jgi:thymidylate synthase (FAD)
MKKMVTSTRLISYSQPSEFDGIEGLEDVQDLIAYCAKVSNPSAQVKAETSERLIRYLVKHKHWSPLEMASACIEINTTRDIAHQIVRHRSFAFQEFSQRYAEPSEMENSMVTRECRLQDATNRQNSVDTDDSELKKEWELHQNLVIRQSKIAYDWAIENGIAKEQARVVLPEGCTRTRLYMNGSLRSWIHYIELRGSNGTQKEHMEVAQCCALEIAKIFPLMEKL